MQPSTRACGPGREVAARSHFSFRSVSPRKTADPMRSGNNRLHTSSRREKEVPASFASHGTQPAVGQSFPAERLHGNQPYPYLTRRLPTPPDRPSHHDRPGPLSVFKSTPLLQSKSKICRSRVRHKRWRRSTEDQAIRDRHGLVSLQQNSRHPLITAILIRGRLCRRQPAYPNSMPSAPVLLKR